MQFWMVREGLFKVTFEQLPEEGEEGGATDAHAPWAPTRLVLQEQRTHWGSPVSFHTQKTSLFTSHTP